MAYTSKMKWSNIVQFLYSLDHSSFTLCLILSLLLASFVCLLTSCILACSLPATSAGDYTLLICVAHLQRQHWVLRPVREKHKQKTNS